MRGLLRNTRFYILLASLSISVIALLVVNSTISDNRLRTIRLEQVYGIIAIGFLYLAVLATPLTKVFTQVPYKSHYLHARRALGVSAFYFSALHVGITFFGQLGAFSGIQFLTGKYIVSLSLGLIAVFILMLMAMTSFDIVIKLMTFRWWKFLHRFVYLASIAILVHIFLISSHFSSFASFGTQILLIMLIALFLLEAVRIDRGFKKTRPGMFRVGPVTTVTTTLSLVAVGFVLVSGFNVSNNKTAGTTDTNEQSSSSHDESEDQKQYTVSITNQNLQANTPAELGFSIYDGTSGLPISPFASALPQFNVTIVNDSLDYYTQIPLTRSQTNSQFAATTTFPKAGYYILYIRFFDSGKLNTVALSTKVGNGVTAAPTRQIVTSQSVDSIAITAALKAKSNEDSTELSLNSSPSTGDLTFNQILLVNSETYEFELFNNLSARGSATIQSSKKLSGTYKAFVAAARNNTPQTLLYTLEAQP